MTYIKQAVILAGGKGKRLSEITGEAPKVLVKIGKRPVLEHQIIQLRRYDVTDIVLCVKHISEKIEHYFGNGSRFGVNITYSKEKGFLGTAGAVKFAERTLDERFLVVYGDVMFNLDIKRMTEFHHEKNALATLVIHKSDHPHDSTIVEVDEYNRVIGFSHPPHREIRNNLTNAAFYLLEKKILRRIPPNTPFGFTEHLFPKITKEIYGYITDEYLKDMGTPERLERVTRHYKEGGIFPHKRAVFLDRDGVINEEADLLTRPEQLKLIGGSAEAIKKLNENGFWVIVVTNQPVVARNLCTEEDLDTIHKKLKAMLAEKGAHIDAIYYCPHHPERGHPEADEPKYRRECECRKPKIGMLKRASEELNFNLSEVILIGDRTVDIKTGNNAGCKTILVKTGYGGKDGKYKAKPDHVFGNLLEASIFIIKKFKGRV